MEPPPTAQPCRMVTCRKKRMLKNPRKARLGRQNQRLSDQLVCGRFSGVQRRPISITRDPVALFRQTKSANASAKSGAHDDEVVVVSCGGVCHGTECKEVRLAPSPSHKKSASTVTGKRSWGLIPESGITPKMVARHCSSGYPYRIMRRVLLLLRESAAAQGRFHLESDMAEFQQSSSLSWGDAIFLYVERPGQPLSIASVSTFEGAIQLKTLRDFVESKLPLIPRYLQHVVFPPFNLGLPSWQFDPNFDIRNHVRQVILRRGTEADLKAVASKIVSSHLDRQRPLWDLTLVRGLEGHRTGLVVRIHHCLADGVAGVGVVNVLMDPSPVAPPPPGKPPVFHAPRNATLGLSCWKPYSSPTSPRSTERSPCTRRR